MAKIIGTMCLVVGLAALNKKFIASLIDEMENSKALFWFVGFVAVLLGVATLAFYDTWSLHWPVLITVFGWLALIKGIIIMLFPGLLMSFYKKFKTGGIILFSGIISFVFGVILLFEGFAS